MQPGPPVPPWEGRRARRALADVKQRGRTHGTPCRRCHLAIDYDLVYPHRRSCSVGHIKSRRDYPELTWEPSNWAPEHLDCNQASDGIRPRDDAPDLGVRSGW